MADSDTESATDQTDDTEPDDTTTEPSDDTSERDEEQLGEAGKKALERERKARRDAEKRAKELEPYKKRVEEAEEADKTEKQRLEEQLEQLKPTAHEAAKLRVALRKGLTETQAKRLVGESEEDLEADADDLLASFQTADSTEPDTSRRPQERLRSGATPDSEPEETDPRKLAADVPRY